MSIQLNDEQRKLVADNHNLIYQYLIDNNLFPSATKQDEDNPYYQNWIYVRTPELEEALENYEPFNRSKK